MLLSSFKKGGFFHEQSNFNGKINKGSSNLNDSEPEPDEIREIYPGGGSPYQTGWKSER